MDFDPKKLKAIYVPSGRAREYAPLAVNLYNGCTHGCAYCYAPGALRKVRTDFHAGVVERVGILDKIKADAGYLVGCGIDDEILLCFHCDPYWSDNPQDTLLTAQALEAIGSRQLNATVLTKGGMRAATDFSLMYRYGLSFGTSLSWTNEADRRKWEPGAASVPSRINAIMEAHRRGIHTWVSIEPVIDPRQALELVPMLLGHVDLWKVGKLNHDAEREQAVDWPAFRAEMRRLLDDAEASYIFKRDLEEA